MRASLGSAAIGAVCGVAAAEIPGALLGAAAVGAARPLIEVAANTVIGRRDVPERAAPYLYAYTAGREIRAIWQQ
jgi:hypothetical protein